MGRAATEPDPDRYEQCHAHCDVLVIGAGPAGLAAALAASRSKSRVMLVEQDIETGGSLLWQSATIDGERGLAWRDGVLGALASNRDCQVLTHTTAVGYFDHNSITLVERINDNAGSAPGAVRHRLWIVRAKRVVLATGAIERPIVFPGNDRPGVMLASAVQQYLVRWAVMPGERVAFFTDNDTAYAAALAVLERGGRVACLVDSRSEPPPVPVEALRKRGVAVCAGSVVVGTHGWQGLRGITVADRSGQSWSVRCDVVATSGGWNPTVHLFSQSGGKLAWDHGIAGFRPATSVQAEVSVGAAAGEYVLVDALQAGWRAGGGGEGGPVATGAKPGWTIEPLWEVAGKGRAFVDLQHDVTTADIKLARQEAFVSVEHLKRYTTLGMAPDQGKTSNVNGLAILARSTARSIEATGTTRFRFPYTPVSLGVLAGDARGELFRPLRRLPTHALQVDAGATFEEFGGWLRPVHYRREGESAWDAEQREARAVRTAVGLFESSPLGKIEVAGNDAAWFLDRICANTMSTLKIGRARYGLMLDELGNVIDDGVTLRLAEDRFIVGTTGGAATRIADWLEEWHQCEWPRAEVLVAPVTTSVAVLTLSGPRSRALLRSVGCDIPLAAADFPHMTFRVGTVAGIPARVVRASFTGEITFEINVARDEAAGLWRKLMAAGQDLGVQPVGIDAWMLLRTEKGYMHVGVDTDGSTSPLDIGWARVLKRADDFVGRRSLTRPALAREGRLQFVGIEAVNANDPIAVGEHLRGAEAAGGSEGFVTSAGFSAALGRWVALGCVRRGRARYGEELRVVTGPGTGNWRRVTHPGAYDPKGERLNG